MKSRLVPLLAATPALFAAAFSSTALAQSDAQNARILARTGVSVGGATISALSTPLIAESGKWAARCLLDGTTRRGLLVNGNLVWEEGGTAIDGKIINRIRHAGLTPDGVVSLLFNVTDPASPGSPPIGRLRIGNDLVLQEGDMFTSSGPSGAITGFFGYDYDGTFLAVGLSVETSPGTTERLLATGSVVNGVFSSSIIVAQGEVFPGSSSGLPYFAPTAEIQTFASGGACHTATFSDGITDIFALRSLGDVVAEDGEAGPIVGTTWNFTTTPRIRTTPSGPNLYSGQLNTINGNDRGAIFLSTSELAREGGPLGGADTIGDFETAGIALAEDDTPFWSVPLVGGHQVLVAGSDVLLRTGSGAGSTSVDGRVLTSLFADTGEQAFDITPDGRTIVQLGTIDTGETVIVQVERLIADEVVCTSVPNSTGDVGRLLAVGSRYVALNDLRVQARDLPLNAFGYLVVSRSTNFVPNPGGSSGNLCIGPTIGRYVDQIGNTGTTGRITTDINLTMIPQPTGFEAGAVGETWYFELWHRDSDMGTATSNFTSAIGVSLQ